MKRLLAVLLSFVLLFGAVLPTMATGVLAAPSDEEPAAPLSAETVSTAEGLTLTLTTNVPVKNGSVTVDYPEGLTLESASSSIASDGVNTVNTAVPGKVTVAWATVGAAKAGDLALELKFSGNLGAYTFTVTPKELFNGEEKIDAEAFDVTGSITHFCPSAKFIDVNTDSWYHEGVDFVVANGLMNGVSDNEFDPAGNITRGMIVTVLYRAAGAPAVSGKTSFVDVPEGAYYSAAAQWASETGIAKGYEDGTFLPNQPATRQEVVTFLYRYAKLAELKTTGKADLSVYPDGSSVQDYAKAAMEWAVSNGLVQGSADEGKLYLLPISTCSRAQYATMLMRLFRLSPAKYTVTFEAENAKVLVNDEEVTSVTSPTGEQVTFRVVADEGYEIAAVVAGDETLESDGNGYYAVSAMSDVTVKIGTVQTPPTPVNYTVTLEGEHLDFYYNGEATNTIQAPAGTKYVVFNAVGQEGYHSTDASADHADVTELGNLYIVSNIQGNTTVSVGAELNVYTISYSYRVMASYRDLGTQQVTHGQCAVEPDISDMGRTGYHLSGKWFTDPEMTQQYDFSAPVTHDMVLYTDWELNVYTVTFHTNGGSEIAPVQVQYNKQLLRPTNPTREGYTFAGWFTDPELTTTYNFSQSVKADLDLYAAWFAGDLQDVYLDGRTGNDNNTGTNPADAVKTFARAKELLGFSKTKVIRITGTVTIADTETWDLSDVPGAYVVTDAANTSYAGIIRAGASLTLTNLDLKGNEKGYMFFQIAVGGTLTLGKGAIVEDNTASGSTSGFYVMGTMNIEEGATIRNITGTYKSGSNYGMAQVNSGATVNMNGGLIENIRNNSVAASQNACVFSVAGSTSKTTTYVNLNGGTIRNCGDGKTLGGVIYSSTTANIQITLDGATIENCEGSLGVINTAGKLILKSGKLDAGKAPNAIYYSNGSNAVVMAVEKKDALTLNGAIFEKNSTSQQRALLVEQPLTNVAGDWSVTLNGAGVGTQIAVGGLEYLLTEEDLAAVKVNNDLKGMLKTALSANAIVLDKTFEPDTAIYLDGVNGSDSNDGLTPETAVLTFAKAKSLLASKAVAGGNNWIYITNTVYITKDEDWSLKGIEGAKVMRGDTFKSYMIVLGNANASADESGNLTLSDIVIDGNGGWNNVTNNSMIRVNNSTLTINDGTVLCNNGNGMTSNSTGGAMYICALRDYTPTVIMNGGVIEGNYTTTSAGGVYLTGAAATFIMNGGEIRNNVSRKGAGITDNTGCNVRLNGGKIYGNTLTSNMIYAASSQICIGSASRGANCGDFILKPAMELPANAICLGGKGQYLSIDESFANWNGVITLQHSSAVADAVAVKGVNGYTLTEADLAKFVSFHDGFHLELDAANNQIILKAN